MVENSINKRILKMISEKGKKIGGLHIKLKETPKIKEMQQTITQVKSEIILMSVYRGHQKQTQ